MERILTFDPFLDRPCVIRDVELTGSRDPQLDVALGALTGRTSFSSNMPGFRFAASGIDFDGSAWGTDSLAFGGMSYVSLTTITEDGDVISPLLASKYLYGSRTALAARNAANGACFIYHTDSRGVGMSFQNPIADKSVTWIGGNISTHSSVHFNNAGTWYNEGNLPDDTTASDLSGILSGVNYVEDYTISNGMFLIADGRTRNKYNSIWDRYYTLGFEYYSFWPIANYLASRPFVVRQVILQDPALSPKPIWGWQWSTGSALTPDQNAVRTTYYTIRSTAGYGNTVLSTDTHIYVQAPADPAYVPRAGNYLSCEGEILQITFVNSPTDLTVTRGLIGTTAASHAAGSDMSDLTNDGCIKGYAPSRTYSVKSIKVDGTKFDPTAFVMGSINTLTGVFGSNAIDTTVLTLSTEMYGNTSLTLSKSGNAATFTAFKTAFEVAFINLTVVQHPVLGYLYIKVKTIQSYDVQPQVTVVTSTALAVLGFSAGGYSSCFALTYFMDGNSNDTHAGPIYLESPWIEPDPDAVIVGNVPTLTGVFGSNAIDGTVLVMTGYPTLTLSKTGNAATFGAFKTAFESNFVGYTITQNSVGYLIVWGGAGDVLIVGSNAVSTANWILGFNAGVNTSMLGALIQDFGIGGQSTKAFTNKYNPAMLAIVYPLLCGKRTPIFVTDEGTNGSTTNPAYSSTIHAQQLISWLGLQRASMNLPNAIGVWTTAYNKNVDSDPSYYSTGAQLAVLLTGNTVTIDSHAACVTYAIANTVGWMGDTTHRTSDGRKSWCRLVSKIALEQPIDYQYEYLNGIG